MIRGCQGGYPGGRKNATLRASRETELLDEFPIKDVCTWIGNSQVIAMKHYAMMRESSFARAAGLAHGIGGPAGGPDLGDSSHSEAIEAERDAGPKMKKPR